jgi:hypothetical protein
MAMKKDVIPTGARQFFARLVEGPAFAPSAQTVAHSS